MLLIKKQLDRKVKTRRKKMEEKEKMMDAIEVALDNDCLFYYDMIEVALVMINQSVEQMKKELKNELRKDDGYHNCKINALINKIETCDKCYDMLDRF